MSESNASWKNNIWKKWCCVAEYSYKHELILKSYIIFLFRNIVSVELVGIDPRWSFILTAAYETAKVILFFLINWFLFIYTSLPEYLLRKK